MGLAEYKRKRDFAVTAEPKGGKPLPRAVKGASRFVIQKHDASRLHYDFRLEMNGVLKSWAVPKGLPWGKGEKHLAVEVEDHPVEYADFEGVIPEGQYGGGTVMVWDRGDYFVYGENPLQALKEGRMHIVLHGDKAHGEWALIRTRIEASKPQWLLLKSGESLKPLSKKRDDQSAKTGRTMKEIAEQGDAVWNSNREDDEKPSLKKRIAAAVAKKKQKIVGQARRQPSSSDGSRSGRGPTSIAAELNSFPSGRPKFMEPMKAKLVGAPPQHGDWIYELKFDGFRLLAVKNGNAVSLFSRNENELRGRFPEVAQAVENLPIRDCVIDGEVVALDEKGRSSFQLLQALEMEGREAPTYYYAFDLLQAGGHSLINAPLSRRKELLAQLCRDADETIRISGEVSGEPRELLDQVARLGLEGIIGKLRDSKYEIGRRSGAWIKIKAVNEQEFVIGGYTPPGGSRKHFGALLVGYYEEARASARPRTRGGASLRFAGKVGSGFNTKSLASLHKQFKALERDTCPFADLDIKRAGKWGITPAEMRRCTWVEPKLVAQIKFTEWTRDGKLRQPVFLGLREDKRARDVVREQASS